MFFDDKKKIATTIIGKRNPATGDRTAGPMPMMAESTKDEQGEIDPLHLAAEDILAAHHEKSSFKLVEALGNFLNLHSHKSSEEPNEEG